MEAKHLTNAFPQARRTRGSVTHTVGKTHGEERGG